MANEIQIQLTNDYDGLTIEADIKNNIGQVLDTITLTDRTNAFFSGSVGTLAKGSYAITYRNGTDIVGAGELHWDGSKEITFHDIEAVRKGLLNNMKVDKDNNQLVIYEDDGTTEFERYDLFDLDGSPTNNDIYEINNA